MNSIESDYVKICYFEGTLIENSNPKTTCRRKIKNESLSAFLDVILILFRFLC